MHYKVRRKWIQGRNASLSLFSVLWYVQRNIVGFLVIGLFIYIIGVIG